MYLESPWPFEINPKALTELWEGQVPLLYVPRFRDLPQASYDRTVPCARLSCTTSGTPKDRQRRGHSAQHYMAFHPLWYTSSNVATHTPIYLSRNASGPQAPRLVPDGTSASHVRHD